MVKLISGILMLVVGFFLSIYVGTILHYAWETFAPTTFEISKGSFIALGMIFGLFKIKMSDIDSEQDTAEVWSKVIILAFTYMIIHFQLYLISCFF